MALTLKPDVVITDMVMPDYDGMYVVRSLMQHQPVPIILLSALEKTNAKIFDALQHGAFEFIDKPAALDKITIRNYHLIPLIKAASQADLGVLKARQVAQVVTKISTGLKARIYDILVIGASTGGPTAIENLLSHFPADIDIPVVIAQHMPERFLETFSARLNGRSNILVKLAQKDEKLAGGVVYITPGNINTVIEKIHQNEYLIRFTDEKYVASNFPSIDCLLQSVAISHGAKSMAIILSGMGTDGAQGLAAVKQNGGCTIVQDESSSVVYGMPKAAIDNGAVAHIVSLPNLPEFILSRVYRNS
jgi:two-component system chemotaxis response regulator CheB